MSGLDENSEVVEKHRDANGKLKESRTVELGPAVVSAIKWFSGIVATLVGTAIIAGLIFWRDEAVNSATGSQRDSELLLAIRENTEASKENTRALNDLPTKDYVDTAAKRAREDAV